MAYRDDEVSILRAENTSLRYQLDDKSREIKILVSQQADLAANLAAAKKRYYEANDQLVRLNDKISKPAWEYEGKYPPTPSPIPVRVLALLVGMLLIGFSFGVATTKAAMQHHERHHVAD